MPSWLLAFIFGIGATAWLYNKLAHTNGNASPKSNMLIAGLAGLVIFLICWSLLTFILKLE